MGSFAPRAPDLTGQAALDFLAADIELNAQGLEHWLDANPLPRTT